jgi:hypothetical protein
MVVVEGAARLIGKTINAEISRLIQTDAGKMLFAYTKEKSGRDPNAKAPNSQAKSR